MTSRRLLAEARRWSAGGILLVAAGCSASTTFGPDLAGGGGSAEAGAPAMAGSLGLGGTIDMTPVHSRCTGDSLRCRRVQCPADSSPSTTSVSGFVYDPAGRVPLYNAVVYVVDESKLVELGTRAQCESCSAHFPDSALALALTGADGSFTVRNMPAGPDVPLVIQLGKWRRKVKVNVEPCVNTKLPKELTRLPRNSMEGDLPKIAVTTGGSDALECLVRKIGVDESEFSPASGGGRVHLFSGFGAAKVMRKDGKDAPLEVAEELWASSDRMLDYDMMLMSCEGDDNVFNAPDDEDFPDEEGAIPRPAAMHLEVRKYADLGGRIFGSHWHHRWIGSDSSTTPENPYPEVATFAESAKDIGEVVLSVDTSFPKGIAFHNWLVNVGASAMPGKLPVVKAEHSVDAVDSNLARRWIYGSDPKEMVQYFSFTTPVGAAECGRMVFSDVHVTFGGGDLASKPFPERCGAEDVELTPQEKALAFMIFDLSSCIQKENDPVRPPITVVK